jgi:transcription antitermination factor NusG
MDILCVADQTEREAPKGPIEIVGLHWYAAYTLANHEKRVMQQFTERSVEHFLPLYESMRSWKDRKVKLRLPLFPGYVFVRLAVRDRLRVLQVPSVVRLVGFNGHPAALPDKEIEALRTSVAMQLKAEPHPYLTVGRRVRIKSGPLTGVEGILTRKKNAFRVVLSLDFILRSAAVEVDVSDIERI